MRAALAIALVTLLIGCGADDRQPVSEQSPRIIAGSAPQPAPAPTVPAPSPREALPRSPATLSLRLAEVSTALRSEIVAWRASRPTRDARPPQRIARLALYEQRCLRMLARRPRFAAATLRHLPRRVRAQARDGIGGLRALFSLTSLTTESRFRTGPADPPGLLLRYYRAAQQRFGVRWTMLAAVNMIESNFGRLRNVSNAGAIGPMQFMPATWRAYGLGGDIRDPRDAILGAANYLHASGAPGRPARALYAYNPSRLYVAAVERFAHAMAADRVAYYAYWSWQSFMRTRAGDVQLTGPGRRGRS